MKKIFLLFFVVHLQAQNFPVSENNGIIYTQDRFGVNLINGLNIYLKTDGSIIVGTYLKHIFKISNNKIETLDHYFTSSRFLTNYFEIDDLEVFCTSSSITTLKKGIVTHCFTPVKSNEQIKDFSLDRKNKIIYYYLSNEIAKTFKIYQYDIKTTKKRFLFEDSSYRFSIITAKNGSVYFFKKKSFEFYELKNNQLVAIVAYPELKGNELFNFQNTTNFDIKNPEQNKFYRYKNKQKNNTITIPIQTITSSLAFQYDYIYRLYNNGVQSIFEYKDNKINTRLVSTQTDRFNHTLYNPNANAYYNTSSTNLSQLFCHLKKYPRLFYNTNSNSVFAMQQDNTGRIYTASYTSGLVTIKDNKLSRSTIAQQSFLNGSHNYQNHILLLGENNKGVIAFEKPNKYWKLADSLAGYYLLESSDKRLYLGTNNKGLYYCKNPKLIFGKKLKWETVSIKEGLKLENILTITEDKFGNIWCGQGGIAVYNPKTNKAITWLRSENEKHFGSIASLKDSYQTIWFPSTKGELYYYDGKHRTDYNFDNFKKITHPLLEKGNAITFVHQWNDFLILGAGDRVLLFNLKKWHTNKTVSVRYLNAYETNFSAPTEQNTIFTDKRDQSIWFCTSDMVYNWDIKTWLALPTFKVKPTVIIKKDSTETTFCINKKIHFKPTENSFDIQINYQTKDNLPRYLNAVLVKENQKPVFEKPNLQTQYHFADLSSGNFIFYVRVCQQDGSFAVFEYPIEIDSFVWQKWWFWIILSIPFILIIIYFFQKRNQIEIQKKKLSQLNLSSLSNQFRPHFMLNALNSIGSQMKDKPHAEKVISRLGESINILYGFTQKNKFTLAFSNEMKLVENSIEIQKLLFIPELVLNITNKELMPEDYKMPVGVIQIPVENALLHGLRHKTNGDCLLEIDFKTTKDFYTITITDNGVGREKAGRINNFKSNGNGLKTVFEMIKIINNHQKNAISFEIIDHTNPAGTSVKIVFNKNIDYDKIKI